MVSNVNQGVACNACSCRHVLYVLAEIDHHHDLDTDSAPAAPFLADLNVHLVDEIARCPHPHRASLDTLANTLPAGKEDYFW